MTGVCAFFQQEAEIIPVDTSAWSAGPAYADQARKFVNTDD